MDELTSSTKPIQRQSSQAIPDEQAEYQIRIVLCLIKARKADIPWYRLVGVVSIVAKC